MAYLDTFLYGIFVSPHGKTFPQRKHSSPEEWLYVKFAHKDKIYWLPGEFHL
jgi:hypothetical protein